jgi:hypothetical protein
MFSMFSTLFKWVKRAFWAGSIFLGLYYFGDFSVSGVNVRDYLHGVVPPEKMDAARATALGLAKVAYQKIDEKVDVGSHLKSIAGSASAPELMDKISSEDQEKMVELLKSNLDQAMDPNRQKEDAKRLQETIDSITGTGKAAGSETP